MEVAVLVDVCEAAQDLKAPLAHARLRHQLPLLLHQLVQVAVLQQPSPFGRLCWVNARSRQTAASTAIPGIPLA